MDIGNFFPVKMGGIFRRTPPERLFAIHNRYLAVLIEGDSLVGDTIPHSPTSQSVHEVNASYHSMEEDSSQTTTKSPRPFSSAHRSSEGSGVDLASENSPELQKSPIRHRGEPVDISGIDFDTFSVLTEQTDMYSSEEFSPEKLPEEEPIQSGPVSVPSEPDEPMFPETSETANVLESHEDSVADSTPPDDTESPKKSPRRSTKESKRLAIPTPEEKPPKRPRRAKAALDPIEEEHTPKVTPKSMDSSASFECPNCRKNYKLKRFFDAHVVECSRLPDN